MGFWNYSDSVVFFFFIYLHNLLFSMLEYFELIEVYYQAIPSSSPPSGHAIGFLTLVTRWVQIVDQKGTACSDGEPGPFLVMLMKV